MPDLTRRNFLKLAGATLIAAGCDPRLPPQTPVSRPPISEIGRVVDDFDDMIETFNPTVGKMVSQMRGRFSNQSLLAEYTDRVKIPIASPFRISLMDQVSVTREMGRVGYLLGTSGISGLSREDNEKVLAPHRYMPTKDQQLLLPAASLMINPNLLGKATLHEGVPCFGTNLHQDKWVIGAIAPNVSVASLEALAQIMPGKLKPFYVKMQRFYMLKEMFSAGLTDVTIMDIAQKADQLGLPVTADMKHMDSGTLVHKEVISTTAQQLFGSLGGFTMSMVDVGGYPLAIREFQDDGDVLDWLSKSLTGNRKSGDAIVDAALQFVPQGSPVEMSGQLSQYVQVHPEMYEVGHVGDEKSAL